MSRGIGAYYSPAKTRPVHPTPPGARPAQRQQGVGAYYSPAKTRPVPPVEPGFQKVQPTQGWEDLDNGTKSLLALLGLVTLGYFLLRGR